MPIVIDRPPHARPGKKNFIPHRTPYHIVSTKFPSKHYNVLCYVIITALLDMPPPVRSMASPVCVIWYIPLFYNMRYVYVIMTGNGHIKHLKVSKYNLQPSEARLDLLY